MVVVLSGSWNGCWEVEVGIVIVGAVAEVIVC